LNGKARIRGENVEAYVSVTQDMKRQMRKSAHCDPVKCALRHIGAHLL